jgi:hypothetical protein
MTNGEQVYQETLENAETILMMLQKDLGRERWKGPMVLRIDRISTIGELRMVLRAAPDMCRETYLAKRIETEIEMQDEICTAD